MALGRDADARLAARPIRCPRTARAMTNGDDDRGDRRDAGLRLEDELQRPGLGLVSMIAKRISTLIAPM